jgi:hypothetical protein
VCVCVCVCVCVWLLTWGRDRVHQTGQEEAESPRRIDFHFAATEGPQKLYGAKEALRISAKLSHGIGPRPMFVGNPRLCCSCKRRSASTAALGHGGCLVGVLLSVIAATPCGFPPFCPWIGSSRLVSCNTKKSLSRARCRHCLLKD